jgi:hypothetical protein
MSIKGLKEALAKKHKMQNPDHTGDSADVKVVRTPPIKVANNRPPKRVTGRGR